MRVSTVSCRSSWCFFSDRKELCPEIDANYRRKSEQPTVNVSSNQFFLTVIPNAVRVAVTTDCHGAARGGSKTGDSRYFKTLSGCTLLEPPEGPWKVPPVHTSQLHSECISVHVNHVRIKHRMCRGCVNSAVCIHILISCFASFDSPASCLCFSFEVPRNGESQHSAMKCMQVMAQCLSVEVIAYP